MLRPSIFMRLESRYLSGRFSSSISSVFVTFPAPGAKPVLPVRSGIVISTSATCW